MTRPPLSDYPYEPDRPVADVYQLEGLDKLRCVQDPGLRRALYDLYWAAQDNETDPRKRARVEAWERSRSEEEREQLLALAEACLAGKHGEDALGLAQMYLVDDTRHERPMRTDLQSLRAFADELRKLRRRQA